MSKFMRFSLLAPIVLAGFLCVSFPRSATAVEPPAHADTALVLPAGVLSVGSVTPSAYYYYRGRRYPYRYHGMYYSHRYYRGGRYRYY